MPLTFPLSIDDFWARLPIGEIQFNPPPQQEIAQTGGGEVMSSDLGPMLWRGQITMGKMLADEASHPDVLLDVLGPSGGTFMAYDTRRPAPRFDPRGLLLGASVPVIASLPNARDMSLSGLPAWYPLCRGDYLAFDYGVGRRALHRVVTVSVAANAAGTTPVFEVAPMIRPGAVIGTTVTLVRAACKAKLVPGQTNKGSTRSTITEGMSFQFIQTLK